MFMHIGGRGSARPSDGCCPGARGGGCDSPELGAAAVGFLGTAIPEEGSITPESIDNILGLKGAMKGACTRP